MDDFLESGEMSNLELERIVEEMKEQDARGELYDWDELIEGLDLEISEKPEGYDLMIPEEYR